MTKRHVRFKTISPAQANNWSHCEKCFFNSCFFVSVTSFASSKLTRVPSGTSQKAKYKFSLDSKKISLAELKAFDGQVNCTRYDQNLQYEFTQDMKANLVVGAKSAELSFEGDQNKYTLVDRGVDTQAINTTLIGDSKLDVFITVRKADVGTLMIKGDAVQTKTGKTEVIDGVVYNCK